MDGLKVAGPIAALMLSSGCSTSSEKISAAYVTPLQYQNYTCQQLGEEAQRVSARVAQVSGVQDEKVTNDAVATGVAIVLFWPAAFMIGGDGQTAAELARLKGEFEAVEKVAVQKNCGFHFQQQTAPSKTPSKDKDSGA